MEKTGLKPTDELVRRAIIGDGRAFAALWDTYIDTVRGMLTSGMHIHDDFLVDDICSRSFEKAFRQIHSYDPHRSAFATWLSTIARRTALDVLDTEKRLKRDVISIDSTRDSSTSSIDDVPDQIATPLDTIIQNEDETKTLEAIDALPELYRDVARKRLIDRLEYKAIADQCGLSLNTVKTRIRRARALLDKKKTEDSDV